MPHVFERRIARAVPPSDTFVSLFPSPFITAFCRFVSFAAGAIVGVIGMLGLVSDEVVVNFKIPEGDVCDSSSKQIIQTFRISHDRVLQKSLLFQIM